MVCLVTFCLSLPPVASISSCSSSSASLVLEIARFLACRAWASGLRARAALGTAHGLRWDVRKVAGLGAGDEFLEFVPPTSQEHETAALAEQSAVDSKSRLSSDRKALRKARLQHRSEPSLRLLRKERETETPLGGSKLPLFRPRPRSLRRAPLSPRPERPGASNQQKSRLQ